MHRGETERELLNAIDLALLPGRAVAGNTRVKRDSGVGGCGSELVSCPLLASALAPGPASGRIWRPLCVPARLLPAARALWLLAVAKYKFQSLFSNLRSLAAFRLFSLPSTSFLRTSGFVSQLAASRFWKI